MESHGLRRKAENFGELRGAQPMTKSDHPKTVNMEMTHI
jgi:hypothetical protein